MPADVLVESHGTVALFTPMTEAAHDWVEENVHLESWQRVGCSIACEPRYLNEIIDGMTESGLVVE